MDANCQNDHNSITDINLIIDQLNITRKEINNLRQQLKSFRYIHEKEVTNIKRLLSLCSGSVPVSALNPEISSKEKPSTSQNSEDLLKLKPIGVISTCFPRKRGTPRQSGISKKIPGRIILFNSVLNNPEHALEGLHEFSHMWILFHFHQNDSTHIRAKVAPPKLNGARLGVFSTRSPHRPCPIGLSLVRIVEIKDNIIYFEGVDMINDTPVLDIKPYIPQYDNPFHAEESQSLPVLGMMKNDSKNQMSEITRHSEKVDTTVTLQQSEIQDSQVFDISRDVEIAQRLQAEEFQDNYFTNPESEATNSISEYLRPSRNLSENRESSFMNSESTTSNLNQEIENTDERSRNIYLGENRMEDQVWRNSRLLEGADGPNTVCSTNLDLLRRRASNSRLDNSPVRMGVREAPDGEEGLASQTLTLSQTVSNIQNVVRSSNNPSGSTETSSRSEEETRMNQSIRVKDRSSEVRVPDWISRSQNSSLTVLFNERALAQLNVILDDKTDEKKIVIENVLREDPRSIYLRQRWGNQFYTFLIHDLHITCRFDDNRKTVTVFQVRHAGRTCECGEVEWQCLGHSTHT